MPGGELAGMTVLVRGGAPDAGAVADAQGASRLHRRHRRRRGQNAGRKLHDWRGRQRRPLNESALEEGIAYDVNVANWPDQQTG